VNASQDYDGLSSNVPIHEARDCFGRPAAFVSRQRNGDVAISGKGGEKQNRPSRRLVRVPDDARRIRVQVVVGCAPLRSMLTTFPMIHSRRTGPQKRLSSEAPRLSPRT
jgi:hypothetical protein